jgi:hypothetical protein
VLGGLTDAVNRIAVVQNGEVVQNTGVAPSFPIFLAVTLELSGF